MVVPPNPTKEDGRIERNRGRMGVIFFRKERESRGLSSGSIVKLKGSKLIRKCEKIEYCLMTSDKYLPVRSIGDYFFEYWSSDLNSVEKHSLKEVAQSDAFYNPTPGLALIPVRQSLFSKLCTGVSLKSSVIDERRAFPTSYHSGGGESENKLCYIVRSCGCEEKESVERFTLMTKRDDQGQLQYELLHVDDSENVFRNHDDIIAKWSNLYPHGAVILENDDGPQLTCVGILNFTEEGLISPVFFTPETLTGEVQLYYPTDVQEEASPAAMEPTIPDSVVQSQEGPCSTTVHPQAPCPILTGYEDQSQMFSSAGGTEDPDGASQTNDDLTVYPDDYTLQYWQKLYEEVKDENTKLLKQQSELYEVKDENTKLKQQSEDDQRMISRLKKEYSEENEELRAENEDLRKGNENMCSKIEMLRTRCKQLREDRDAESIKSRDDYQELLTEIKQLKTNYEELHERNRKLLTENIELRKDRHEKCKELYEVIEELYEVIEELLKQNSELKLENEELYMKKEELSAMLEDMADQFKKVAEPAKQSMDDTSSIKDSNNVKAEEPSVSLANSTQDSDGSRKEEEPFFDPLSKDVSKLD